MKKVLCPYLGLFLSCVIVMSAGGCSGGSSSMMPSAPITVSISPQAAAIGTGESTQFSVATNDSTGVTWTASAGTIDANGNYTAPSPQGTTATDGLEYGSDWTVCVPRPENSQPLPWRTVVGIRLLAQIERSRILDSSASSDIETVRKLCHNWNSLADSSQKLRSLHQGSVATRQEVDIARLNVQREVSVDA